jgi:hypothetical protein
MWEPQRLTTLWAFTACYRDSLLSTNSYKIQYRLNIVMCHDIRVCLCCVFTRKQKKIYLVPLEIIKMCHDIRVCLCCVFTRKRKKICLVPLEIIKMCHDIRVCLCCFFTRKQKKICLVLLEIIKMCQEYLS